MPLTIVAVDYPAPAFAMTPRALANITDFIIHHTAGAVGQTPLEIDAEHRNEGWAMIGYNYVITPDGTVYEGRSLNVEPSAAYGRNMESIDVVLVGNFDSSDAGYTGPPTDAQLDSLLSLGIDVHQKFPTIERTIGHCDVATMFYPTDEVSYSTACPGNELYSHLPDLKSKIAQALSKG